MPASALDFCLHHELCLEPTQVPNRLDLSSRRLGAEAGIVIGSKSNKRQMKATKDSGDSFSDFNTRPYPAMNGEQGEEGGLESTQDELKRLNKQIETLMAQDGSA